MYIGIDNIARKVTAGYLGVNGVAKQFYGADEAYSSVLSQNSWRAIARASKDGVAQLLWSVGDEIDITLTTGETLTLQIYGFNHDDLADGTGKAGITFGMQNLMAETRRMEATNTNANSFSGSELYGWLSGTLANSLPGDLRNLIRPVVKKTSAGYQSTVILSETMPIFLFSEVECFNPIQNSFEGEGMQYTIFLESAARVKYLSNGMGSVGNWYTRSPWPSTGSSFRFCSFTYTGYSSSSNATNEQGICFGFCI